MSVTGKYAPLYKWFKNQPREQNAVELSFDQIERIIHDKLPRSAFKHDAWWRDKSAKTSHVQAFAWLEAGWLVRHLNLRSKRVTFVRGLNEANS